MRFLFLLLLFLASCRVPDTGERCIADWVCEQKGQDVSWGPIENFDDFIHLAVQDELTAETAAQIALLHNPQIQALFENVGVAHADLVEAGLFSNPRFYMAFRVPNTFYQYGVPLITDMDSNFLAYFLDIFLVPLRKKIAQAALQQVQMEVAQAILDLSYQVEEAYYDLIYRIYLYETVRDIAELKKASAQIIEAQAKAGNVYKVDASAAFEEAYFAQAQVQEQMAAVIKSRQTLNELMGFEADETSWRVPDDLALPNFDLPSFDCLLEQAFDQRLDYSAKWWQIDQIARQGALYRWWSYTEFMLGIAAEREPERLWIRGPAIGGALPIFNWGQGMRRRVRALMRQQIDEFKTLKISISNEVALHYEQLHVYKENVLLNKDRIVPLRDRVVQQMSRLYNVMNEDPFNLIAAEEHYLDQVNYLVALRNYWTAQVKLRRAVGGRL